ncbi:MAG: hypothetical protein ACFFBD_02310 [Candidatus Hodarchaeota archaeon]
MASWNRIHCDMFLDLLCQKSCAAGRSMSGRPRQPSSITGGHRGSRDIHLSTLPG